MSAQSTDDFQRAGKEVATASTISNKMPNPFRQPQSKEAVLFDDLQSARSAILSGSARNRYAPSKASSKAMSVSTEEEDIGDGPGEQDAIPLKNITPAKDLPLPPVPAMVSNIRRGDKDVQIGPDNAFTIPEQSKLMPKLASDNTTAPGSLYNSIKNALANISSPVVEASSISDRNGANYNYGNLNTCQDAAAGDAMQSSTGRCPNQKTESGSTLPEGSTVGNIYKHYASSGRGEEFMDGYKALQPTGQLLSSGSLAEQLLGPSTPPPKIPLPILPALNDLVSDTRGTPLHNSNIFSDAGESTVPSLPRFSPKNPFRARSRSGGRSVVVSYASDEHCVYEDHPGSSTTQERLPLEREVSEALRRASGLSFYSMASVSSSILENGRRLLPQASHQAYYSSSARPQKLEGFLAADPDTSVQERSFYDQNAMVSGQATRYNNAIRVPIVHDSQYPETPPVSPENLMLPPDGRRSDLQDAFLLSPDAHDPGQLKHTTPEEDWETVGESVFGTEQRDSREYPFGMYGTYGDSTIRRAGSSIANTSDAGSLSLYIPEIDNFNSSTDRITQHPAKIDYSGDYRQRELKKINIPVLLPSFKEHKVNGYLADSTRIIPPNPGQWFRSNPKPLQQPHRHPFKSTPPDVSPRLPTMPKSKDRRKANHFPPKSKVQVDQSFLNSSSDSRPSSWQNIMAVDSGGYNSNASGVVNAGQNEADIADLPRHGQGTQTDGNVALPSLHERLERRPLVRGPPGAFYAGLRSDGKRRVTGPHQEVKPARNPSQRSTREYPTNELRPLSLLSDGAAAFRTPTDQGHNSSFLHRIPQPPQRQSWRDLYTPEQMQEIERRTARDSEIDRQYRIENWQNSTMTESVLDGMAPRQFFEAPTLQPVSRRSVEGGSLKSTRDSVSMAVLFICAFFPPFLGLYIAGTLDGVMYWATNGEYTTYTARGKKLAWALLFCWLAASIIGLIIFITWWFTLRKNH